MFENPILIFFLVLIAGLWLIDKINEICSFGDLFNGRAFSFSHYTTHIDREFNGFFYVLLAALGAGAIALIIPCFANNYTPKRVFIQDLVSTGKPAQKPDGHARASSKNTGKPKAKEHKTPVQRTAKSIQLKSSSQK